MFPLKFYSSHKNLVMEGFPWWFSGEDSVLPLQGGWVQYLVRELRHAYSMVQSKLKKERNKTIYGQMERNVL